MNISEAIRRLVVVLDELVAVHGWSATDSWIQSAEGKMRHGSLADAKERDFSFYIALETNNLLLTILGQINDHSEVGYPRFSFVPVATLYDKNQEGDHSRPLQIDTTFIPSEETLTTRPCDWSPYTISDDHVTFLLEGIRYMGVNKRARPRKGDSH